MSRPGVKKMSSIRLRWPAFLVIALFILWSVFYAVKDLAPVYFEHERLRPTSALMVRSGEGKTIVFIHGWTGRQGSWEAMLNVVLRDESLTSWGVAVVDYETVVSGRDVSLEVKAKHISKELRQKVGKNRLVLVAHSLGGVISQIITLQNRDQTAGEHLIISGLLTYGSPHGGIVNVPALLRSEISAETVEYLKQGGEQLSRLQADWVNVLSSGELEHVCVCGTKDLVVSERSALFGCGRNFRVHDGTHSTIIQPENRSAQEYGILLDFVRSVDRR